MQSQRRQDSHPSIYFMMDADSKHQSNPAMVETLDGLRRKGFQVDVGIAEELVIQPDQMNVIHDLYVIKSNTELSLSLAGVLNHQGARTVNDYRSCMMVKDKILTSNLLRARHIPMPMSWVTGKLDLMGCVLRDTPLVIKPHRGNRGKGVRLIQTLEELQGVGQPESPVLIQEFVSASAAELKVYVVDQRVYGVRKAVPQLTAAPQAERPSVEGIPCGITEEIRDIALECGDALGLGLYGLDVLETSHGPVVVDVNSFPSFRGAAEAAPYITDYIACHATGDLGF